jgi:hypothetical protein
MFTLATVRTSYPTRGMDKRNESNEKGRTWTGVKEKEIDVQSCLLGYTAV